jgi:hypothetical protein
MATTRPSATTTSMRTWSSVTDPADRALHRPPRPVPQTLGSIGPQPRSRLLRRSQPPLTG